MRKISKLEADAIRCDTIIKRLKRRLEQKKSEVAVVEQLILDAETRRKTLPHV